MFHQTLLAGIHLFVKKNPKRRDRHTDVLIPINMFMFHRSVFTGIRLLYNDHVFFNLIDIRQRRILYHIFHTIWQLWSV